MYEECEKWVRKDLETLKRVVPLCRARGCVIQAGCNTGIFPEYLSGHFREVLTFEPVKSLRDAAAERLRGYRNVFISANMLSNTVGENFGYFTVKPDKHEGTNHFVFDADSEGVLSTTIDCVVGQYNCHLLCLDIEGMEPLALKGAKEVLKKHRPIVLLEVNGNCGKYGYSNGDVRDLMEKAGYERVGRRRSDDLFMPVESAKKVEGFV